MLATMAMAATILELTTGVTITGLRHPAAPPPGTDPATIVRYYPEQAQAQGIEGQADVICKVAVDGSLSQCALASEKPAGRGVGERAVFLASHLIRVPADQLDALRQGDGLVADAEVKLPVRFVLGDK